MTRVQRAYSVFLTICLFGVMIFLPEAFFLRGNLYRQFPLYRFLEERKIQHEEMADLDTLSEITGRNLEYAKAMAETKEATPKDMQKQDAQIEKAQTPKAQSPEKENQESQIAETQNQEKSETRETTASPALVAQPKLDLSAETLSAPGYLLQQFFIVDESTTAEAVSIDAKTFLETDFSIKKEPAPKILIYHSHSQEDFADSRKGEEADTVVGVGDYLTELLEKTYGYQVLHIKENFDLMSGTLDRSKAYDYARTYVEQVLKENPSVEVVIDLHRDGIPEDRHLVTRIHGKDTAQLLFYNGLSYTKAKGALSYLPNPYIQENLAFSFQLEYGCAMYYPDLYRGIYLAGLRYNLHLKPRALLLEAGAQTNTVQEVKNAMEPFAAVLDLVLSGNVVCPE